VAELALTINGRSYTVACDDGQEDHLRRLAGHIDQRVCELAETVGQVGEPRLLVMASLLIADELSEAYAQIAELEIGRSAGDSAAADAEAENGAAEALESCAGRLEALAARLEQP
jgi:cell division protein ZapA